MSTSNNEVRLLPLNDEGKENLEAVEKLLEEQTVRCSWITPLDAVGVKVHEEDILYCVDPTQGPEVDRLVKLGCTVIGPQCALTVLKHSKQMKQGLKYPVYNLTMMGSLVCFSNIQPKQRLELTSKIERMGGSVSGILTQDVSHLVVNEVGSVKYFSAAHVGIPIMLVEWIEHLWRHGQSRYISAKDGKWEEFRCPIFRGCSVCVTGFPIGERNRIQNLITKFGGEYSGAMRLDVTTHLVVFKPEGQKFAMASEFGVKTVNVKWVYESVDKQSCQDHNKYPVKTSPSTSEARPTSSTPEGSRNRMPSINDMSNISVMTVNETVSASMADISRLSTFNQPPSTAHKIDLVSFPMNEHFEQVLDGICVYLAGFTAKETDKFKKILSFSGATRLIQMTQSVSHVIIGSASLVSDDIITLIQSLMKKNQELFVVSYKWVLNSLQQSEILPEVEYWEGDVIAKPLDHDETHDVTKADETTVATKFRNTPHPPNDVTLDNDVTHMNDVLSQYIGNDDVTSNDVTAGLGGDTSMMNNFAEDFENKDREKSVVNKGAEDESLLFSGKTFLVCGFADEDHEKIVDTIESVEGEILPVYSKKVAEYAVVPVTGWQVEKTVGSIVTPFWLDHCIKEGEVLSPTCHPLCTPFTLPDQVFPLDGCVACLSKYQDPERSHLVALVSELGGEYQDNVAKKDLPADNLRRTTHLIIPTPEGDKYNGCKKWGIPCVTAEWVYACARSGRKCPEEKFFVENKRSVSSDEAEQLSSDKREIEETKLVQPRKEHPWLDYAGEGVTWVDFPPLKRPPSKVDSIRKRMEARIAADEAKRLQTPAAERIRRLYQESPSTYKDGQNISFDLTEVFELLKTPANVQRKLKDSLQETPLSDFVKRFHADSIRQAEELLQKKVNINLGDVMDQVTSPSSSPSRPSRDPEQVVTSAELEVVTSKKPLDGVVLYVAKKLTKIRAKLSSQVQGLGGEFRWTYDSACTHFVFQGKLNDTNKEFRSARSDKKFIVSPHWVTVCCETTSRADEESYPHDFNPNKSIQVLRNSSPKARRVKDPDATNLTSTVNNPDATNLSRFDEATFTDSDLEIANLPSKVLDGVEDSQEAREKLRKTLDNIMSSTSGVAREAPRLSYSRPEKFSSPANVIPRRSSAVNQSRAEKTDSSQDVQVVWDDPIGREERERLLKVEACGSDDQKKGDEISLNDAPRDDKTPSIDQTDHKNVDSLSQIIREGRTPAFLISSVAPELKAEYAAIVEKLGGIYLDRDRFDDSCTHLIVKRPVRNEKYLASLSSGKWILSTSYMEACRDANAFVKEETHEFGNPCFRWNPQSNTEALLVTSAFRWRSKLNEARSRSTTCPGAFSNWKAILHVVDRQTQGFKRLIESGGGSVLSLKLPYHGSLDDATHAFIDVNKAGQLSSGEIESLVTSGVHCCLPEYIADYLLRDPPPTPDVNYLPQAKVFLETFGQTPSKRPRLE